MRRPNARGTGSAPVPPAFARKVDLSSTDSPTATYPHQADRNCAQCARLGQRSAQRDREIERHDIVGVAPAGANERERGAAAADRETDRVTDAHRAERIQAILRVGERVAGVYGDGKAYEIRVVNVE